MLLEDEAVGRFTIKAGSLVIRVESLWFAF